MQALRRDGKVVEQGRVTKLLAFRGPGARCRSTRRRPATSSRIAGLSKATVADTHLRPRRQRAHAAQPIDPPTLTMTFRINDGPLAGREGNKVQSRVIRERLMREAEGNVAIKVTRRRPTTTPSRSPAAANCSWAC